MQEEEFVPGLDPGLVAWLRMREQSREIKEAQGGTALKISVISDVRGKLQRKWIDEYFGHENEERVHLEQYKGMILASEHHMIPRHDLLALASSKSSPLYTELLIEARFDLNLPLNIFGRTMLHQACYEGDVNKISYLLTKGMHVNAKDEKGNTPLHLTMKPVSTAHPIVIIENLLRYKAQVNCKNKRGQSPLHLACILHDKELIKLLVDRKARLHEMDDKGLMPIDHVREAHKKEIMTIMKKSVLRSSVVKVYAKAEAKSVVKNIFTLITKRCPKCQKTLTGCVKTKNSEYR